MRISSKKSVHVHQKHSPKLTPLSLLSHDPGSGQPVNVRGAS